MPGPDTCLAALVIEHCETGHQKTNGPYNDEILAFAMSSTWRTVSSVWIATNLKKPAPDIRTALCCKLLVVKFRVTSKSASSLLVWKIPLSKLVSYLAVKLKCNTSYHL